MKLIKCGQCFGPVESVDVQGTDDAAMYVCCRKCAAEVARMKKQVAELEQYKAFYVSTRGAVTAYESLPPSGLSEGDKEGGA